MAINARVISGSDPGAIPGGSTNLFLRSLGGQVWGRNRIDGRVKTMLSPGRAPLEAHFNIVANDNFAEGELMAA